MSIILMGLAAFAALRTYNHVKEKNPESTEHYVSGIYQGAELLRIITTFVTSVFLVLSGLFKPQGMSDSKQQKPHNSFAFGSRVASDED